jgi:hypothetical protein
MMRPAMGDAWPEGNGAATILNVKVAAASRSPDTVRSRLVTGGSNIQSSAGSLTRTARAVVPVGPNTSRSPTSANAEAARARTNDARGGVSSLTDAPGKAAATADAAPATTSPMVWPSAIVVAQAGSNRRQTAARYATRRSMPG